jgi:hypothetical protein
VDLGRSVKGQNGFGEIVKEELFDYVSGKQGAVGGHGDGEAAIRSSGSTLKRSGNLVNKGDGEKRLTAVKLDLYITPLLQMSGNDPIDKSISGRMRHPEITAEPLLITVATGEVALKIKNHGPFENGATGIGPLDETG